MKTLVRIGSRVAMVAAMSLLFIWLSVVCAHAVPAQWEVRKGPRRNRMQEPIQRPKWPEPGGVPGFVLEAGLFGVITFAARKILRLRLSD
jgi:hypothetical protein